MFLVIFGTKNSGFRNKRVKGCNIDDVLKYLNFHDYNIDDIFSITRLD